MAPDLARPCQELMRQFPQSLIFQNLVHKMPEGLFLEFLHQFQLLPRQHPSGSKLTYPPCLVDPLDLGSLLCCAKSRFGRAIPRFSKEEFTALVFLLSVGFPFSKKGV